MSFKSFQKSIEKKSGVNKESAGAILASASRNASPSAKKANPKLNRVKMAPGGSIRNSAANEAGPWMKGGS